MFGDVLISLLIGMLFGAFVIAVSRFDISSNKLYKDADKKRMLHPRVHWILWGVCSIVGTVVVYFLLFY